MTLIIKSFLFIGRRSGIIDGDTCMKDSCPVSPSAPPDGKFHGHFWSFEMFFFFSWSELEVCVTFAAAPPWHVTHKPLCYTNWGNSMKQRVEGGGGDSRSWICNITCSRGGLARDAITSVSFIFFRRVNIFMSLFKYSGEGIGWRRAVISDSSQEAKWKFDVWSVSAGERSTRGCCSL